MSAILAAFHDQPVRSYAADEIVLDQGGRTERLFVLIEGAVEVEKGGVHVAKVADPGAMFGDMSVLLGVPHTAKVRTLAPSRFHVVEQPRAFLEAHPAVCLHLCEMLARRLDGVNNYLVDVKRQYEGHDHLAMVDGVLETLLHRQPRKRVAPRAASIVDPELLD